MGALIQNTVFGRNKKAFISTWRTSNISSGSSATNQIKLPLIASGNYNFVVDWGDGTSNIITAWNQSQTLHNYVIQGDYIIKINGTCVGWQFNNSGDRLKLISIERWGGNFRLGTNQGGYFYGCANLKLDSVSDILNLTGTTNLSGAFRFCNALTTINRSNEWNTSSIIDISYISQYSPLFNPSISSWNVGNVTTMQGAFFASGFNNDISNWNTSKNTNLYLTFADNNNFNQNIGDWNTGNVINMQQMFQSAGAFNQNIGKWNVSNVTNFLGMFKNAKAFNNAGSNTINNWNTSSATTIQEMFSGASVFNQPLNDWNTSNVNSMNGVFTDATIFNQDIGSWNVSNVVTFQLMFAWAIAFNNGGKNSINKWILNTSNSININMNQMFSRARSFNQPIGNWNTVRVNNMSQMFPFASSFNQDIDSWNVSNVLLMQGMFGFSVAFNQNIGSWDVSKVINFDGMFDVAGVFNNGGSNTINNWNTGSATTMQSMFKSAEAFNHNIGSWNVSNVTNFTAMFAGATSFNNAESTSISNWNTVSATTMQEMFRGANSFNQNIGLWNVSNVNNFTNFMALKNSSNYSSSNLDSIYNGWTSRPVKTSININFNTIKRTAASDVGKSILTSSPNNWIINDGGI